MEDINPELLKEIQVLEKMNVCYDIINELKPDWSQDWESFEKDMKDRKDEIEGKSRDISFPFFLIFIKYIYNSIHSLLDTKNTSYLTTESRMEKFQKLKHFLMEM